LNRARVSVPPPPEAGLKLDAEICCRNRKLPEPMRCEHMYENPQFWYDFLAWEHTARCRSTFHYEYQPWEAYPINEFPPDEEDDDYDVVKKEADEAIEDAAPPNAGNLPPEYQPVLAAGYDEDALLQQVLEASKANEYRTFPDLQEALALAGMVAKHLASLPPPPPLPPHTRHVADYKGKEVPPPPGVPRRWINSQPQPEVIVNLVSDDEK
jgi:hypothetical protein